MTPNDWFCTGSPLDVQVEALKRSRDKRGYGYFMEMGLGKTATILSDFWRAYANMQQVEGLVVKCPFTLTSEWAEQARQWSPCEVKTYVWPERPDFNQKPWIWTIPFEGFCVGGAKAVNEVEDAMRHTRIMLTVDESIRLKNYKSVMLRQSIKRITPRASLVRLMSGLPTVKGADDLWGQFKYIGVLEGVNFFQWRRKYCTMGEFRGKKVVGIRNSEHLEKFMDKHSFRAYKDEWSDLPPKVYKQRRFALTGKQLELYTTMHHECMVQVDNHDITTEMAITKMGKLQQISSGFIFNNDKELMVIKGATLPKVKDLKAVVDNTDGKLLVGLVFPYSIDLLEEKFAQYNPTVFRAGVPTEELQKRKHIFNNSPKQKMALCQTSTVKYGYTLIGHKGMRCHTTYMYENSYSLDDRKQFEDRNHRTGQDSDHVLYLDPVCNKTESDIIKSLINKERLTTKILRPNKEFLR